MLVLLGVKVNLVTLNLKETRMTKTGNSYLRYFLIQAANITRQRNNEYRLYFHKV